MPPRSFCGLLLTAAVVAPATGCFIKPDRPGASADAAHDSATDTGASGVAPIARKAADAYYSSGGASNGMSQAGYTIPTADLHDGELVLFIANIDNGSNTVWMLPPGFHQLHQINYGGDGQTFVVGWKVAAGETNPYTEPYGPGINSGHAVITLVAVTGFNPAMPIADSAYTLGNDQTQSPAVLTSNGVAITAASSLLIFAGGVDWDQPDPIATATFTEPAGFTALEELSDRGGLSFDWTTQMISTMAVPAAGPAVARTASIASNPVRPGTPWTVEIAIAPAPQ